MKEILDNKGHVINPGTYPMMEYNYDKSKIKIRESRIKEWDFYQFTFYPYILQLTIGHASLFDSCGFGFINMETNKRYDNTALGIHTKNRVIYEPNPEKEHKLEYISKNQTISFTLVNNIRHLVCTGTNKEFGDFNIDIKIDNNPLNNKMVINIPFKEDKRKFYLNYKENYYSCIINAKIGDLSLNNIKSTGLIDSGRGYWPYKHEWWWGSASINLENNHTLGWNIGFGFGDTSNGTENYFFYDSKSYKIEPTFDVSIHPNGKVIVKDNNFYLELNPIYDNYTETKVLWINNNCHQVFYKSTGYVIVDNKKIVFKDEYSFLEHAKNRW